MSLHTASVGRTVLNMRRCDSDLIYIAGLVTSLAKKCRHRLVPVMTVVLQSWPLVFWDVICIEWSPMLGGFRSLDPQQIVPKEGASNASMWARG
jgi:hypothetical protein